MDKIKRFMQPVKILNLILILNTILGFCIQVYFILSQYMLGKTVVNIEVKRLKSQQLPAITVCIPTLFSISKLSKLNEINKKLYQDYMKLIDEGETNRNFSDSLKQELRYKYNLIKENSLDKVVNLNQLFELSMADESIEILITGRNYSVINELFFGKIKFANHKNKYHVERPINSVLIYDSQWICFAYFSGLEEYWNQFEFDLDLIKIVITNNFTQYDPATMR